MYLDYVYFLFLVVLRCNLGKFSWDMPMIWYILFPDFETRYRGNINQIAAIAPGFISLQLLDFIWHLNLDLQRIRKTKHLTKHWSIGISLPYPTNDGPVADTELALFVCRVQLTKGAVCITLYCFSGWCFLQQTVGSASNGKHIAMENKHT